MRIGWIGGYGGGGGSLMQNARVQSAPQGVKFRVGHSHSLWWTLTVPGYGELARTPSEVSQSM